MPDQKLLAAQLRAPSCTVKPEACSPFCRRALAPGTELTHLVLNTGPARPQQEFCLLSTHRHLNPCHLAFSLVLQVLDVSGAAVLAKSIANCQVELLENCGHSVVMERPRKTAKLIVDFLASVPNTDNNKKLD